MHLMYLEIWDFGLVFFRGAVFLPAEFTQAETTAYFYFSLPRHNFERLCLLRGKINLILIGTFLDIFHHPDQREFLNTT